MANVILRNEIKKYAKKYTFKEENMGTTIMAGKYNLLKNSDRAPECIGFFVGNANQLCSDINKFLSSEEQQKRIAHILAESRDGVFSSIMKYSPNEFYSCKGLLGNRTHNWKDGAIDLHYILIRFLKEGENIRLLSIYPVLHRREKR